MEHPREELCRAGGRSCGACCFSPTVRPDSLRARLRRHRLLFRALRRLSPSALARYELRARRGWDLIAAPLLSLPWLGPALRAWLAKRVVCAFLAFEDAAETRVGCLIHPRRLGEERRGEAFRFIPGFACGSPDYLCDGARRYAEASEEERAELRSRAPADWYGYSREAPSFPEFTPSQRRRHAGHRVEVCIDQPVLRAGAPH